MAMQTDILSATATSSSVVIPARARVKGVLITTTSSAGSVVFKDGGASGTTRITLNTPAVAEMFNALLPGEGVLFSSNVYLTLTNVSSVTVFYG